MTEKQIRAAVARAIASLNKIEEALPDKWLDYEYDDLAAARSAMRKWLDAQ